MVVPPTADRDEAVDALSQIQAENGTAIGDAIARSLDLGLSSLDKDKVEATARSIKDADGQSPLVILLLSDGASTTGDYTPLEAAQLAKDAGVPVYTVALGTDERHDPGPRRLRRHPHDPRAAGSRDAEGRSPRRPAASSSQAADAGALKSVYDEIGSQVGVEHKTRELTVLFTAAGAAPAARRRRALDALVRPDAVTPRGGVRGARRQRAPLTPPFRYLRARAATSPAGSGTASVGYWRRAETATHTRRRTPTSRGSHRSSAFRCCSRCGEARPPRSSTRTCAASSSSPGLVARPRGRRP